MGWLDPWVGKNPLEEGVATHSSVLVWRIPRTEEAGGLQSVGSQGVRHDWSDQAQHRHSEVQPHSLGVRMRKSCHHFPHSQEWDRSWLPACPVCFNSTTCKPSSCEKLFASVSPHVFFTVSRPLLPWMHLCMSPWPSIPLRSQSSVKIPTHLPPANWIHTAWVFICHIQLTYPHKAVKKHVT